MSKPNPRVALLTIDCVDEWLDGLHLRMDDFAHTQCGGWFNTLHALRAAGYDATLIGTSSKIDRLASFVNAPTGATVVMIPAGRLYRLLKSSLARVATRIPLATRFIATLLAYSSLPLLPLLRLLREYSSAGLIVEQYGIARADVAVMAAAWLDIPIHGMYSSVISQSHPLPIRLLRRLTMQCLDGFAVCSPREAERLVVAYRIPRQRLHATVFPVDTAFWQPQDKTGCRRALGIDADARVAMWHGGFDVQVKGLDTLVAAWAKLTRCHPGRDLRLIIIGNRHGAEPLQQLIARSGATGVQLIDHWVHDRSEIRRYLGAADCYVFPSRTEAFGIAPVEAMACGLPAILSEASGVAELFCGEADGVIRIAPDNVALWAASVERLLLDLSLCAALGSNARAAVVSKASVDAAAQTFAGFLAAGR